MARMFCQKCELVDLDHAQFGCKIQPTTSIRDAVVWKANQFDRIKTSVYFTNMRIPYANNIHSYVASFANLPGGDSREFSQVPWRHMKINKESKDINMRPPPSLRYLSKAITDKQTHASLLDIYFYLFASKHYYPYEIIEYYVIG